MKRLSLLLLLLLISNINISGDDSHWKRLLDVDTYDVSINPKNPNTIHVGGGARYVYRSFDGGATWDTTLLGFVHAPARLNNILINSEDTNIVLVGGLVFGDILRTTDNGETWEAVLQRTYPVAMNGKAMIEKPDDPDVYFVGVFQLGAIFKSTNKGATWDSISTVPLFKDDSMATDFGKRPADHIEIASIAIREDSTDIMLIGSTSGRVYMSTDGGYNWKYRQTLIYPTLAQTDCEVTRIVFSQRDPMVGYASITYLFGTNRNNGGIHKTTDGGYSWETLGFVDSSYWAVSCRELNGEDELFTGGYTEDPWEIEFYIDGINIVQRSQDGGKTWNHDYTTEIDWFMWPNDQKPLGNVWALRYGGLKGEEKLYLATERGLYVYFEDNDDPSISINEDTLSFGIVNDTKTLPLTITNTGEASLIISSIILENNEDNVFSITSDEPGQLGYGESFAVQIQFSPNEEKNYNASLKITSNDPDDKTESISISGNGGPNSVSESYLIDKFKVIPNPVDSDGGYVIYSLTEPISSLNISLYDENGILVKEYLNSAQDLGEHRFNLNTTNFSSGKYHLVISTGDTFLTESIVIVK